LGSRSTGERLLWAACIGCGCRIARFIDLAIAPGELCLHHLKLLLLGLHSFTEPFGKISFVSASGLKAISIYAFRKRPFAFDAGEQLLRRS
jgi:hypothetical protein